MQPGCMLQKIKCDNLGTGKSLGYMETDQRIKTIIMHSTSLNLSCNEIITIVGNSVEVRLRYYDKN